MKTIFRLMNTGLVLAALLALGAVAGLAQDTCNADDVTAAQDAFDVEYKKGLKDRAARRVAIRLGKEFIEKYGANCEIAHVRVDWLKKNIPIKEQELIKAEEADAENALVNRFDNALKSKNWDDVYASGREVLAKYPEKYRPAAIVLGTVGGEEAFNGNLKYADEAVKFAKLSIADLEAGKPFVLGKDTRYGLSLKGVYNFEYLNKDETIGWLNMYIGYITQVVKKDKGAAAPYLYKATQTSTEVKTNPIPYGLIGYYYVDQGDKLADEIQAMSKTQNPTDTEEVAKQKIEAIKAKVALSNGTNQRAADAFSRAYTLAKDAKYKADIKKALDFSYNRRFGKMDGIDAWISNAVKQPFENPNTPITPVSDPEPEKTTGDAGVGTGVGNGTGVGTANGTGIGTANGTGVGRSNGTSVGTPKGTATAVKPTATTTTVVKPKPAVKKPVRKRG